MSRLPHARALLVALALLLVSAAGCSDVEGTGDLEYVSGDGRVVQVAPDNRQDPVAISGTTIQGDPLDLADYRGRVVVINVWWSLCGPCIKEMPMLVEAEAELAEEVPDQTAFVGINIRDNAPENAASFERDRNVDYPSLYDPGSETLLELGDYAPPSMPATLVLDAEGRVAALINGPVPSKATLKGLVSDTLAEDA
ncbi:TlpA family protein disulfide reductase [Nocardioides sp. zg-ZUI104]|uniref:TlpA disulfide reductase family protein n=1 Tax=Nocardioides faecalis TaxID=2803858 RepID=UPI001BD09881|nr:TlpA disulfide reductase family protein [Nocardioides faecalis]MBS4752001.1 TlpA family protein disulfide reductase [Nocardioides faecalis]